MHTTTLLPSLIAIFSAQNQHFHMHPPNSARHFCPPRRANIYTLSLFQNRRRHLPALLRNLENPTSRRHRSPSRRTSRRGFLAAPEISLEVPRHFGKAQAISQLMSPISHCQSISKPHSFRDIMSPSAHPLGLKSNSSLPLVGSDS